MRKWVQFYHKVTPYDPVNHKFLCGQEKLAEMCGSDSILPIDGRWNLFSIRMAVRRYIESMKNFNGFKPCAFSILSGNSILWAHESQIYEI